MIRVAQAERLVVPGKASFRRSGYSCWKYGGVSVRVTNYSCFKPIGNALRINTKTGEVYEEPAEEFFSDDYTAD